MSNYFLKSRNKKLEDRIERENVSPLLNTSRLDVLKHPLVTISFGFVLTGMLGAYLNNRYQEDEKEREQFAQERKQHYELSLKSVEDFTNLVYARRTKAAMLQSSLKRIAPKDELMQRKRDYDIAYSEWNAKLQTTLFGIRRLSGSATYSNFENLVETQLRRPFSLLDACLTDAYDTRAGMRIKNQFKCDTDTLLQIALDCSYAVSDELYKFVAVDHQMPNVNKKDRIQVASTEIGRRCDLSNISVERDASPPRDSRPLP
jgi:hypothetical protein